MLMPVGRLAVLRSFSGEKFLPAMSFVAIPGLIGPLIGPTLGGWLVETTSWYWIFLINLPIGLLGCALSLRHMPDGRLAHVPPFDFAGFALLSFGMMSLSLALDGIAGVGPGHDVVLVLLLFGLVNLAAYWFRAERHPRPLFSPRLFHLNSFGVGLLGNLFARIGSGAMPYLIPLLPQLIMGYSPLQAGMMMLPVAAMAILSKPLVTALIRRFGYRRVLLGNTFLVGCPMAAFSLFGPQPAALAADRAAGLFRLGQFDPVHGDEHGHAQRPRNHRGKRRQQHAVDGTDVVDEPRRVRRRRPAGGVHPT